MRACEHAFDMSMTQEEFIVPWIRASIHTVGNAPASDGQRTTLVWVLGMKNEMTAREQIRTLHERSFRYWDQYIVYFITTMVKRQL
jgi:hypothetical protein